MNKKELVAAVAAKTEMTQVSVEKALKAIIEATVAEVAKKGKVQLIGFGTFEARERAARNVLPAPARTRRMANRSRLPLLPFLHSKQAKPLKTLSMQNRPKRKPQKKVKNNS